MPHVREEQVSLDSVRAITLDLYGTLLDVESGVLQPFADFLTARGHPGSARDLAQSWQAAYFQEMMIDTLLGLGRTPFEQISRSALGEALSRLHIAYTSEDIDALLASRAQSTLYPDVQEGLLALRDRYTLAVLSNGDLAPLERLVEERSIPVHRVISAEQAGVYKPHPDVYRTGVEQLGLERHQVLHVAAHAWDVRAAKTFGMLGAYINRDRILYGDFSLQPDLEVSDLRELAARLT